MVRCSGRGTGRPAGRHRAGANRRRSEHQANDLAGSRRQRPTGDEGGAGHPRASGQRDEWAGVAGIAGGCRGSDADAQCEAGGQQACGRRGGAEVVETVSDGQRSGVANRDRDVIAGSGVDGGSDRGGDGRIIRRAVDGERDRARRQRGAGDRRSRRPARGDGTGNQHGRRRPGSHPGDDSGPPPPVRAVAAGFRTPSGQGRRGSTTD